MLLKYGNLWSRVEFNDGLLWTGRWIVWYHEEENLLCLHLAVVCHILWKPWNIVYYTSTNWCLGGCEILKSFTIDGGWVDLLLSVRLRLWLVCWPSVCAQIYEDLKQHKPDRLHAKSRVLMEREYQSSETERVNAKNWWTKKADGRELQTLKEGR
jgi:hypothetical protein